MTDVRNSLDGVLVIGYGSPLRGDDAVGRVVAARVDEMLHRHGAQVLVVHQLTPELAEPIADAELVIFVDASVNLPPGTTRTRPLVSSPPRARSFEHHVDVGGLLDAAESLYGRRPEAWSVGVGGALWGFGEHLSSEVETALPRVIRRVLRLITARAPAHAGGLSHA